MATKEEPLIYESVLERDGVKVSKSPWGADDEIGRLNWLTPETQRDIITQLDGTKTFDLAVDNFIGMPSWGAAGDPKFDIWMTHTPRGSVNDNLAGVGAALLEKHSYCGDSISMYTHCGTHMDALNHFGYFGCFWNGWTPEQQLGSRHWMVGGMDKYPPIFARGVLLDVPGLHGVECLPPSHAVTPKELTDAARKQMVELRRGDVVCVRTGQMTKWPDPDDYLVDAPGLGLAAVRYLCEEAGAMCIAGDNIALEVLPMEDPENTFLPVHCYMFATAGAPIIEVVNMEEIAAEKQYVFAFLGFPIKIRGATGAPLRPVAVPLR